MKWEDMINFVTRYKPWIHYHLVKWELPQAGYIKCNTDRACRGNPGIGSYGFYLRNEEGDLIYAQGENIGFTTNVVAEMRALQEEIKYCKENNIIKVQVESDSLILVRVLKRNSCCSLNSLELLVSSLNSIISGIRDRRFLELMAKAQSNEDYNNDSLSVDVGELRDIMQQLITKVGSLAGKVSSLEKLDQTVIELKNQLSTGETLREKTPLEWDNNLSRDEESEERGARAKEKIPNNYHYHHSNFNRWSRMEYGLMEMTYDLGCSRLNIFFAVKNVPDEEKVKVATL
ncbi:hypothetical protein BC332_21046 [Capsicum chinense]|nr:hypothetical protein BC332_21046 [Capsicum chinense]